MTKIPSSEWQAEQFRLTAFTPPWDKKRETSWWNTLVGIQPEEVISNLKLGSSQVAGKLGENGLVLSFDQLRIDWLMAPAQSETTINLQGSEFPIIGIYEETITEFETIMEKWLTFEDLPEIKRLAFGCVLKHPEPNRDSGYSRIPSYLPININPSQSSDFLFQINHPKNSIKGPLGLKINRLSKWSIAAYNRMLLNLAITPINLAPQYTEISFAFRLELDISTDNEYEKSLSVDQLVNIFKEMIVMGREIAFDGISNI